MRIATAAVAMVAVSVAGCRHIGGTLTRPIETTSASQFDALVNGLGWRGGVTTGRCTDKECRGAKVQVSIEASEDSYQVDSLNGGSNGVVVARVQNLGNQTTYMYHLKPGQYYYFLVKASGTGPRWVLLEPHARAHPDSVDGGRFIGCFDHLPARAARADFKECDPPLRAITSSPVAMVSAPTASLPVSATQPTAEAPGWIGCKYGCCPMGQQ